MSEVHKIFAVDSITDKFGAHFWTQSGIEGNGRGGLKNLILRHIVRSNTGLSIWPNTQVAGTVYQDLTEPFRCVAETVLYLP